ncbi:MAG: bifunctional precorrin-2 dehydrogenase/sirohydrochlorin ferrochelatase [Phycisphaerales bacterium]|nr:MAG: bifunctional precorrin-2 dehydrogenase/sirohydrochlorin ferrochelatase [Phycisphaerales bacterium]
MAKYPIFLELGGRRAVIIGGGSVAVRKAQSLLAAGTRLVVVAERISDMMTALCTDSTAELITAPYSKDYLVGAVLAIAATNSRPLNERIYKDCQQLEILCNVVDVPELCDFFVPAVVKRGSLQVAIGTEGASPAYAAHIRKKLEAILTEKHGQFLAELEQLRKTALDKLPDPAARKVLSGRLAGDESFDYFVEKGPDEWRRRAAESLERYADADRPAP